jgi:DNA-binding LacI/PurR family transcriptional regulator
MAVTLRDVAQAAGVSVSAVSRSFTEGAPVSADTRARILRVASRLGYQRNHLASGLTTGRTRLVALIVDEGADAPVLGLMSAVGRGLEAAGLRPVLIHLPQGRDTRAALRPLREHPVEAAVLISAAVHPVIVRALHAAGVAVVQALAPQPGQPDGALVSVSEAGAGREAARLLLSRGYRRLGFIGGPEGVQPTRDRFAGFRNYAERHGGEVEAAFAPAFGYAEGQAALRGMLERGGAEAWFCADDRLAIGALAALREAGVRVPEEAGVLGMGGIEAGGWSGIDLTTLAAPQQEMAEATVTLALDAIRGTAAEGSRLRRFDCRLLERGTLRPAQPR